MNLKRVTNLLYDNCDKKRITIVVQTIRSSPRPEPNTGLLISLINKARKFPGLKAKSLLRTNLLKNPAWYADYKEEVKSLIEDQLTDMESRGRLISVHMATYMPPPSYMNKAQKERLMHGQLYPYNKDWDNLAKPISDSLEEIQAVFNDRQICVGACTKHVNTETDENYIDLTLFYIKNEHEMFELFNTEINRLYETSNI